MFVVMGLSAIFPVLHGLRLYGITQMREQIGLSWLVLQGVLYILGAGIYAVSRCQILPTIFKVDMINRLACPRNGFPEDMMFGVAPTRSSMYSSSLQRSHTSPAWSKPSIIVTVFRMLHASK
jgi:predicted membrane channel-forming protein YqfA (hemolysin III family)